MKLKIAMIAAATLAACTAIGAPGALAKGRTTYLKLPIADVMTDVKNEAHLAGFKFTFGAASGKRLTDTHTRSTDPRPFKTDDERCQRAFLNALIKVRKDAEAQGGTGVSNIVTTSTESGAVLKSKTEYACIAGGSNARVYLNGDIVK